MDAIVRSWLDGACGGFDVFALTAGQGSDAGAFDLAGDGMHSLEITFGGDSEASLKDIDPERRKLVGHAELFFVMHGAAGRLFSVAKSGIEKGDLIRGGHRAGFSLDLDVIIMHAYDDL